MFEQCGVYKCYYPKDLVLPTRMCRECIISTVVTTLGLVGTPVLKSWIRETIEQNNRTEPEEKRVWAVVDWIIKYEDRLIDLDTKNMIAQGY